MHTGQTGTHKHQRHKRWRSTNRNDGPRVRLTSNLSSVSIMELPHVWRLPPFTQPTALTMRNVTTPHVTSSPVCLWFPLLSPNPFLGYFYCSLSRHHFRNNNAACGEKQKLSKVPPSHRKHLSGWIWNHKKGPNNVTSRFFKNELATVNLWVRALQSTKTATFPFDG